MFKLLVTLLFSCVHILVDAQGSKPFVILEQKEWKGAEGMFTSIGRGHIVYNARSPVATTFAETFVYCSWDGKLGNDRHTTLD